MWLYIYLIFFVGLEDTLCLFAMSPPLLKGSKNNMETSYPNYIL